MWRQTKLYHPTQTLKTRVSSSSIYTNQVYVSQFDIILYTAVSLSRAHTAGIISKVINLVNIIAYAFIEVVINFVIGYARNHTPCDFTSCAEYNEGIIIISKNYQQTAAVLYVSRTGLNKVRVKNICGINATIGIDTNACIRRESDL